MKKQKIVVFGDLPIATKVVMSLKEMENVDLAGVVIGNDMPHNNDPWQDTPVLKDYCKKNDIKVFSIEQLGDISDLHLGLSCRFSKIIKQKTIDLFKIGIINMHGGLLPEFAGLYSCNFSVLYGSEFGGGTLHWIDEGIDTGDILRRCKFKIEYNDTGYTVFQKTQIALYENLISIIPEVLNGTIKGTPIDEYISKGYPKRYFKKNSILDYKQVYMKDFRDGSAIRKIRAFDFPGYEPAYMVAEGEKIYLRVTV